ncbi:MULTISPECIES: hypothetical protein [unclassified Enterococcus]|uniref:hypothetical protein n=1 Tax=unclassified Enterococcus TaxID=2608891 RepID=UPI0019819DFE|nr:MULTISPECIES: hypothetical protein [unclassified Enterococcus]
MGAITIVALYQAFLKYPDYGTKLLSLTHDPTAYSPTLVLSTLTAGAKSATYFFHKTTSILKRKKQRKQLIMVIAAMVIIYFLPVITQTFHQYFG